MTYGLVMYPKLAIASLNSPPPHQDLYHPVMLIIDVHRSPASAVRKCGSKLHFITFRIMLLVLSNPFLVMYGNEANQKMIDK